VEAQAKGQRGPGESETPGKNPADGQEEKIAVVPAEGTGLTSDGGTAEATRLNENDHPRTKLIKRLTSTRTRRILLSGAGVVFTGALATIIGGLILPWISSSSPGAPDATQQVIFQPWSLDAAGAVSQDIHIASRLSGKCWIHSYLSGRSDAYRCVAGNLVLDPCISNPYEGRASRQVICPSPSTTSVALISLTESLPRSFKASDGPLTPWLLILADGEKCFEFAAAAPSTAGLVEDYSCGVDSLYGRVNRTDRLWTIFEQRPGASSMELVSITEAYF
jgi:hypothetical protein